MSSNASSSSSSWTAQQPTARQYAFLFCDLVNSTGLKAELNSWKYVCEVLEPHDTLFRNLLAEYPNAHEIKHLGDGFLAVFADVRDAVACALRFHAGLKAHAWKLDRPDQKVRTRIGIDVGMAVIKLVDDVPVDVFGPNVDVASRVMSAADGERTLLTATAFDLARAATPFIEMNLQQAGLSEFHIQLVRHGMYRIQGVAEPVLLCEACLADTDPKPPASKPPKVINIGAEDWSPEPSPGVMNPGDVPDRPGWKLVRKLGEGSFGRAYLGVDSRDPTMQRVFKFCRDAETIDALRNERQVLQRIQHLKRRDIVAYLGAHLDRPPYFLEFEYVPGGNLIEWGRSQGGLDQLDVSVRLDVFAQIAAGVAAAHRERVFHLDLKPSNILIERRDDGGWQPKITDFGIGAMEIDGQLSPRSSSSRSKSDGSSEQNPKHLYIAPEAIESLATSQRVEPSAADLDVRDVYALGVLLFQLAVGDLRRPLAPSALRQVTPQLLRTDIEESTHFDPRQRLSSAAELERRVRNLSTRERRRFLARTLAPACAALTALCLVMSVTCLTVYNLYRQTRAAEERANAARQTALEAKAETERQYQEKFRAITEFWRDIDSSDDSAILREIPSEVQQLQVLREIRGWLLEQAEKDLERLRSQGNDLDQQVSYARLTLRISQLLDDENLEARERRLNSGLAALKAASVQSPDHPALRLLLSDFENQLAQLAFQRGATADALSHFQACRDLRQRLLADCQNRAESCPLPVWEYERKLLSSVHNLALAKLSLATTQASVTERALAAEADQHAAVIQLQEALDGRLRLAEAVPGTATLLRDVGSSRFTFGRMFRTRADSERAAGRKETAQEWMALTREYYQQALEAFLASQELESSTLNRQRVVEALRELVDFELESGDLAVAAEHREKMIQQVALVLPSTVRDLNARVYFTQAKYSLEKYRSKRDPEDLLLARTDLRLAESLYQTLVQIDSGNLLFWGDLGTIHYDLAGVLIESSIATEREEGERKLRAALDAWEHVRKQSPQQFERLYSTVYRESEQRLFKNRDERPIKPPPTL